MKKAPWSDLLKLLGKSGERIMIELLFEAAIFMPIEAGHGNYCQISGRFWLHLYSSHRSDMVTGKPLFELEALLEAGHKKPRLSATTTGKPQAEPQRTPATISFVRSRMLFARPAINRHGGVSFGLRHIRK